MPHYCQGYTRQGSRCGRKISQSSGCCSLHQQQGGGFLSDTQQTPTNLDSYISEALRIKKSRRCGFGVYAQRDYEPGEVIEKTIYLLIPATGKYMNLMDYLFKHESGQYLLPFGNACIYNHQNDNNAAYAPEGDFFVIRARKKIKKGEQIYVNYGSLWWDSRNRTPI